MAKRQRTTDIVLAAIIIVLIAGLIALYMMPAGGKNTIPDSDSTDELTYEDYNGKNIGILTGTNLEADSFKYFPDSKYFYFDGYPNLNTALESGVIDAFLGDEGALKSIHAAQPQIDFIKERLTSNDYSFAFRKNDKAEKALCDQLNEFLKKIRENEKALQMECLLLVRIIFASKAESLDFQGFRRSIFKFLKVFLNLFSFRWCRDKSRKRLSNHHEDCRKHPCRYPGSCGCLCGRARS